MPKNIDKICAVCDKEFKANKSAVVTCSRACRVLYQKLSCNYRKRARLLGVEYEPVNPYKVFNRDGWLCQICGKPTPMQNRGKCYTNAPELDHRVPMSKGGDHLYKNVQCACRRCNGLKSNKDNRGQLPLFEIQAV